MSRAKALELAQQAAELLTEAGLSVQTGTDPATVAQTVLSDQVAVIVNAPTINFATWHHITSTWDVWIVSGPEHDVDAAWDRIDAAIEALRIPWALDSATPNAFADGRGTNWPAYQLEFTTD